MMKSIQRRFSVLVVIVVALPCIVAHSQYLDTIGVTLLRTVTTNVNGAGIRVAQAEANNGDTNGIFHGTNSWEVNPVAVGQPTAHFTYTSGLGTSTSFTNGVGDESGHADAVGIFFYGTTNQYSTDTSVAGVATNVAHVDNYDATYFYNKIIAATLPANINDAVVNQSFIFGSVPSQVTVAQQQQIDSNYDDYAAQYKTLFVSGAGNSGPASGSVCPPATCYNGIAVGAYGSSASSVGPTEDNGRAKPDITTPGLAGLTSFSTPWVAGAAAVLMQAGLRGDGGIDTNSAADIRTIKSLLLNGAIKPGDWTNSNSAPLDSRYGAGVLNVFNSYKQLAGGKRGYIVSTTVSSGGAHPPTGNSGTISALSAWDFSTNTSSTLNDAVNHYFFNVTNGSTDATFTLTATLVWNRQQNQTGINNLDLFLYNTANSNLVMCSTSRVDNVEHIFIPKLAPGRYDLQVWKAAGTPGISAVSSSETYALAWEFFSMPLNITPTGSNIALTFPLYHAGFLVESTTNLSPPVDWNTSLPPPSVMNNQNSVTLGITNANQFFRLRRP